MLKVVAKYTQDVSVLRRLLYAAAFLSPSLPNFWGIVVEFATSGKTSADTITPEQARVLMENIQTLNASAFSTDDVLFREIIQIKTTSGRPLGVPLVSANDTCILCGSKLLLRKDRPAPVVLYDDPRGTLPASYFHKNCSRRVCSFTQYYGYYTTAAATSSGALYNDDWASLPYFVASKETAFSMKLLLQLDAEIVIGQMSYKQRADIYNCVHDYSSKAHQSSKYVNTCTCKCI